jgi:hypothetical protein
MTDTARPAIHLAASNGHDCADGEGCLFEWYNYLTRRESSDDRPADVSPVLHKFGMALNDCLPDAKRQELVRFLPNGTSPLAGTYGDGKDEARGYLALDWLVRTFLPAWLDLVPSLAGRAAEVRGLAPVVSLDTARAAGPAVRLAEADSAAAWAAAWDAARAAAWAAARAAAWDAAGDAARAAAWDAAWDAARAAAGDAARAAAGAAVNPTSERLQDSAIGLYDQMIAGGAACELRQPPLPLEDASA